MKRSPPERDPHAAWRAPRSDDGSPHPSFPCFLRPPDEPEPSSREALLALLNQLIEAERAGARGVMRMSKAAASSASGPILRAIAMDEARFCGMLIRHVERLGGTPSTQTGAFYAKLVALERTDERLDLLDRGQGWVVRKLTDALPGIVDPALRADLQEMLEVHLVNVERCRVLEGGPDDR